ncbi:uncharacterized protein [Antedon mediterranea]|uniref:uncharacterized protein n=1 Tax=Antedon mediterranea TaxID=105859 RepID=UPI003AF6C7F1
MDFDINDLEPKGPIPTETELARLLSDRTFVDYFNIFLSLPIFAQRLLYRFSEHVFELDPPLKRTEHRLDRVKLMRWLRTHRAPLFFKTDLYLHYTLCKHLLKTHLHQPTHAITTENGLEDKTIDRNLLSKCLSKASGMRRFRTFLVGTAGERGYEFWIDAERFRKATKDDKELSRELFSKISAKYYKNGGVMELWDEWKDYKLLSLFVSVSMLIFDKLFHINNSEFMSRKHGILPVDSDKTTTDSFDTINTLTIVQGFILKSLKNYWVPRFLISSKTTWMKNREVQRDIVYQPGCCMIHVRSLSELTDTDKGSKKQEVMSDNIRVEGKTHLNVLSMFTSSSISTELAATLKLEDTVVNKDQYDENEWNPPDGLPPPNISVEKISEETEPTTPPSESPDNLDIEPVHTPEGQQPMVPQKEVETVEKSREQNSKETVSQKTEETSDKTDEIQQVIESDDDKKQELMDNDAARTSMGSTEKQDVREIKSPGPRKKKKNTPEKGIEFSDLSMLMQSRTRESSAAEETTSKFKGGEKGKKIGDPSLEDARKPGLRQLQKVKENGSNNKTDPLNATKDKYRESLKAHYITMGGGRRKTPGKNGVMRPLTKANLARLEQIANKAMGKVEENEERHKLPVINKKPSITIVKTEQKQKTSQSECDPMVSSLPNQTNKSQLSAFHDVSVTEPCYVDWNLRSVVNENEIVSVFDTIVSDRLAGGPFENFLRCNGQQQNIKYLKFWQKSEDYLNTAIYHFDTSGHRVRYIAAMHIKTVYLTSSSSQCIQLGNHLMQKLAEYLTLDSYVTDECVRYVQGLVCEKLREVLQLFKKYDGEEFLNRTTRKKAARAWMKRRSDQQPASVSLTNNQQPSKKDDITDEKSGDATTSKTDDYGDIGLSKALVPRRIIKSFEHAKSLSSYTKNEDSMADLSDPDSDSDDEGSLKPTKIKVIRKSKEEVKYIEEPEKIEPKAEEIKVPVMEIRQISKPIGATTESRDSLIGSLSTLKTIRNKNGRIPYRPLQPKSFREILRDSSQLEFFRRFLAHEKSDLPLLFWQAVENMKSIFKDAKSRQMKTNQIVKKFFNKSTGNGSALQCSAEIIEDIPYLEKVTPQMIMLAQACVAISIEDNWFELYRDSFPEEPEMVLTESSLSTRIDRTGRHKKRKLLWRIFISSVVSFRRGLLNPVSLLLFENFMRKEVHKDLERQKQSGILLKRVICNKVVIVDRIQNDLRFLAEVERYKQLADNAARAASQGTYTIDDEEFVQLKARAIISCYIDSHVPPKLQINISQEIADQILDTANSGLIERGLFHDATVSIFAVVLYCWKKFCRERFAPVRRMESTASATIQRTHSIMNPPLQFTDGQYKFKQAIGRSVDEAPKITFNLQHGLQLILPPKPKSTVKQSRFRSMMRQLYQSGEFDSGGTNDSKLLLNAMQSQGLTRFSQPINTIRQQLKFAQQPVST